MIIKTLKIDSTTIQFYNDYIENDTSVVLKELEILLVNNLKEIGEL